MLNLFQVPPPVPKKPNVLLLSSSTSPSTNGNAERQIPTVDSPLGLQSHITFSPEDFPGTSVPISLEPEKNHLGADGESSNESSLRSSLQDSAIMELEGKMSNTVFGEGKNYSNSPILQKNPKGFKYKLNPL